MQIMLSLLVVVIEIKFVVPSAGEVVVSGEDDIVVLVSTIVGIGHSNDKIASLVDVLSGMIARQIHNSVVILGQVDPPDSAANGEGQIKELRKGWARDGLGVGLLQHVDRRVVGHG